jgi:protein-S-isoprenylcysteine O-methyltransferase Ste14
MIDVEATGGQSGATIAAKVRHWLQIVEKGTGRRPIIYTGSYFWQDHVGDTSFGSYPIWIAAYVGTFGSSLLRPGGPNSGWLDAVGLVLQGLAIVAGCLSLAALGRSLGLVPAHRGLVTSGAYRLLRHPLYASYVLAGIGYLVQSPRLWNVAVLIVVWTCQVARIVSEEKLLGTDPEYRAYALQTRWRVIPRVW